MHRTSGPPPKAVPISRPVRLGNHGMGGRRTGMFSQTACPAKGATFGSAPGFELERSLPRHCGKSAFLNLLLR